ncbi:MAG: ECF transporter S component [Bacillota bacterium]
MNRKHLSLVLTGILAGMSLVLEIFVHFPILPAADFLLYSPGDLPIIVAAVVVGPFAGAAAALTNAVLFVMYTGQGGPWGAFMHFVASGGMALVIGYLAKKTGKLHVSMLAGILTRVALMVPLNLIVTPIYTGAPRAVVMSMIIPVIIPFNLIHAGINTALSFAVLKGLPRKSLAGLGGRDIV